MNAKIGFFDQKLAYISKITRIGSVVTKKLTVKNHCYTNENHAEQK